MSTSIIPATAKQFDYERAMLWGDRLRILLNSDHISSGEITETLKEKGIFIGRVDRSVTVPLLSSCLLTPSEFKRLIEKSFIRESSKKYSSDKFKLTSEGANWKEELMNNFDSVVVAIELEDGRDFSSEPSISINHNGDVCVTYSLRIMDFSADFIEQEIVYPGEIILRQSGDGLEIEASKARTSKDTSKINDAVIGAIGKFYKSKNITTCEKPKSITFDEFTNSERIIFFMRLTSYDTSELSFKEIGNVEIVRDQEAGALPKEPRIEWMDGHVKKIQIKGSDLGKVFLLQDKTYYQYYYLVKMTATYSFKFGANSGDCGIEFSFSGKTTKDDNYSGTAFDFSIERITRLEEESKNKVKTAIIQKIQEARDLAFQHVKP